MIYAFSTFSSPYYNRQILDKYFFQQTIFCLFKICRTGNFSNMTQASAEQQRMEVERALREADQGAHFGSNFSHIFYYFKKTDLMSFANFYFGQGTLKLQILQKYFAKPICQSYLTHIRCHDQT